MMMNIDPVSPGDRVLCAVSGGADSMLLLSQMAELSRTRGFTVLCAHYNHRQRGEESDRDERFVRDYCAAHGIPCFVGAYTGAARDEASLRDERYRFLRATAAAERCRYIATAHTADDQLETMLLRFARGAGLAGLCGMADVQGDLLRPMLDLTREDVERQLAQNGVPYVEDSSNAQDDYARNRLRHAAVPALKSVNAQAARRAAETARGLREDEDYLAGCAAAFLSEQDVQAGIPIPALGALARPVRARVFRLVCGAALERKHIEALHSLCCGTEAASLDLPGVTVTREQGRLRFGAADQPPLPVLTLHPGERLALPEFGLTVTAELAEADEIHKPLTVYHFKIDVIRGKLQLTPRRPGDSIRLIGRGCTKRVSDLLREGGVPHSARDRVPILRDARGVVAVHGFGVAERCAVQPGEACLCVTIISDRMENET